MGGKKEEIRSFRIYPGDERTRSNLNIFNVLKRQTPISLNSISEKTTLPGDIVFGHIDSCAKKDLLEISGSDGDSAVKFKDGHRKILGIGFKDDHCYLNVMGLDAKISEREEIPLDPVSRFKGRDKEIKGIVERIKDSTKIADIEFCSVGIAVPDELVELNPKTMNILANGIGAIFNCGVLVARAPTAAAYGEKDFGTQTEGKDVLYMHLDVGAGVVIKDEVIFEADVSDKKKDSAYLRPWKQFSIVETARELVDKGVGTSIVNMVNGDINAITLEVVLDAAEEHDELAEDLVKRSGLALGVRVAYLANVFGTRIVVLGGGTEKREGNFIQQVREPVKRFLLKDLAGRLEIVAGVLGREASSIGAASLCRRELFMEV